jgi:hypothetical protein
MGSYQYEAGSLPPIQLLELLVIHPIANTKGQCA